MNETVQYLYYLAQAVPVSVPLGVMFAGLLVFLFLRPRFYGVVRRSIADMPEATECDGREAVSVVICCHNEALALERNLPAVLAQRGVCFEVIVVDDASDDSTADVLKRLEHVYPNLRHTFVPETARYVSREKLAITLGVKAAKYEWVVLIRADCRPAGEDWLETLSRLFTGGRDVVLGYSNFEDDGSVVARRAIYERLMYHLVWFNSVRRRAVGGDGANLAFRRSAFMACGGYASLLDYTFGCDDLLVNCLARRGRTAVCCSPAATVSRQGEVTTGGYRKLKLRRVAAQQIMTFADRMKMYDTYVMNVGHFLFGLGGVAAAAMLAAAGCYVAAGAVCAVMIAVFVADVVMFARVTKTLGAPLYVFSLPYYHTLRPLLYVAWKMKYRMSRRDFARKI